MQVKEKLFILKKVRYGEADLILNCLTPKGARLSLYARSALKSKKRFGGGVLEPTHYIHALYEDKTSRSHAENPLHTLKEATLIDGFDGLRTDYTRLETALHFVQFISGMIREGDIDSSELFNILGNTLRAAEKSSQLGWLRTQFEVKILANQGVLAVEEEEHELLRVPISEHENLNLSNEQWMRVRGHVKRVLGEYVGFKNQ